MNFEELKKLYIEKYPKSDLIDDKLADYFRYVKIERPNFDTGNLAKYYFIEPVDVKKYLTCEATGGIDHSKHPHSSYSYSNFDKTKKRYE